MQQPRRAPRLATPHTQTFYADEPANTVAILKR